MIHNYNEKLIKMLQRGAYYDEIKYNYILQGDNLQLKYIYTRTNVEYVTLLCVLVHLILFFIFYHVRRKKTLYHTKLVQNQQR